MYLVHHISLVILLSVLAILWKKYDDLKRELHHTQEAKHAEKDGKGDNQDENGKELAMKDVLTSVWCFGAVKDSICRYQNLCYNIHENDFVFFRTNKDATNQNKIEISSSSVTDFNGHDFMVTNLPPEASQNFTIKWVTQKGYIMNRFKSDNLMHVLHDDIFPLYHSLEMLAIKKGNNSRFNIQLIFIDGWDPGEFNFMYESMSSYSPIYIKNFEVNSDLICFNNVYVGLSRSSTWYQYGFLKPQGPIHHSQVSSFHINSAVNYLFNQFDIECGNDTEEVQNTEYILLFSRKTNRRILNEGDLMMSLASKLDIKVFTVGLDTHSLREIISLLRRSSGIIGVHGSLLILTAFLPAGSFLLEVFPYAVNPEKYTPYKTLCNIPGMNILYQSWGNTRKDNSVGHPDWSPELGGLKHLEEEDQVYILGQTEVPEHLCCEDPSWLYHIYQDTIIDIPDVVNLLHDLNQKSKEYRVTSLENKMISQKSLPPGKTASFICNIRQECKNGMTVLELSWKPPWNLIYLHFEKIMYELLIQGSNEKDHVAYMVEEAHIQISKNIYCDVDYNVWVRAVLDDNIYGPFSFIQCI